MYARVITYSARPHVTSDQGRVMYRKIIEPLKAVDGFLGSAFYMNDETHQAITITWWRDDRCAAEGGRKSLPLLMGLSDMLASPPQIAGFDVVDQVVPGIEFHPPLGGDDIELRA